MVTQSPASTTKFTTSIWRSLLITIGVTAILPYIVYRVASLHMADLPALLLAGIPPALATLLDLLRYHRVNLFGAFALLTIALNLAAGLLFKDARLLLVSYTLTPGIYGAIMLGSVLIGKPILLTLVKSLLASAPAAERAELEQRWLGRSSFTFVTALWGIGLLLVPVICITLIYTLTIQQYAPIGPIIQYAVFGLLLLISHIYSLIKRARRSHAQI